MVELQYNWRTFEGPIGAIDWYLNFLTNSDKWLLVLIALMSLVLGAYIATSYILAKTIVGILIVLCIVGCLSLAPFYRYMRTFKDLGWAEYLWFYFGWVAGIIYWSFFRKETVFALLWAGCYLLAAAIVIVQGLLRNLRRLLIYLLIINILGTIIFVCVLLFFTIPVFQAALVTLILSLLAMGAIPVAYNNLEGSIPVWVKVLCGVLIGGGVIGIAISGWVLQVASDFAVFSFLMGALHVVLLIMGTGMYIQREQNRWQTPHVYSSYDRPVFKFDSGAEQLKSSISHKIVFDLCGIILVLYAAVVTLIFKEK